MAFLAEQREERIARVEAIVERLAELKMPLNFKAQIEVARRPTGTSLARPHVARAMVAAGYAKTVQAAFDLWLAEGRPAFVERVGPSPAAVTAIVHAAGGLISMAHPGRTRIDEEIPAHGGRRPRRAGGVSFGPRRRAVSRYLAMATELGVLMTGGTDFHADPASPLTVGTVTLPPQRVGAAARGARPAPAAMTAPAGDVLIHVAGVVKHYNALRPLRLRDWRLARGHTVALHGFDKTAAEVLVNLLTGSSLPDEGVVRVFGRATSEIADSTDWLESLRRFALLSERTVLVEQLTVEQNLAIPHTLAVGPDAARGARRGACGRRRAGTLTGAAVGVRAGARSFRPGPCAAGTCAGARARAAARRAPDGGLSTRPMPCGSRGWLRTSWRGAAWRRSISPPIRSSRRLSGRKC